MAVLGKILVEVMDSVPVFQEIIGSNFHSGFENFFFSRGSEEKKVLRPNFRPHPFLEPWNRYPTPMVMGGVMGGVMGFATFKN